VTSGLITVAHVITKLEMGGAQENTLYTAEHLDRSRFRVLLIYGPGGYYDELAREMAELERHEIPELVREVRPKLDARCGIRLRALFKKAQEEHRERGGDPRAFIVHTHSSKAGVLGRFAARAAGVPKIVHTIHGFGFHEGQPELQRSAFIAAELAASHVTDAFISVSKASLAEGQARGIVRSEHKVALIRSGFALDEHRMAATLREKARQKLGLSEDDEVIVAIANLKPQKDPLTLVAAFAELAAKRPRALMLYAGDGSLRDKVEHAIAEAGIGERFRLLGWREDVPDLLAAADVVALSSVFEGLPRSAVQAVAAKRPFVGTRVDGTSEVIRDGRNGFLVEPRDPHAFAQALERALIERPVDPEDEERIEEWDADAMVEAQERLYAELVAT
jgi:glycosyltransferase involved in cell wall biosynthesis